MRRALAIILCCGLGGVAAAADDAPSAAAPAAPTLTEAQKTCDKLAAAPVPLSPQATHPGDIDWPQAITACTQAVEDDSRQARYEFEFGHAYEQIKNYAEALKHYKIAADAGSADGLQSLGLLYFKGLGVVVDKEKAFVLFYRSAETGNAVALEVLNGSAVVSARLRTTGVLSDEVHQLGRHVQYEFDGQVLLGVVHSPRCPCGGAQHGPTAPMVIAPPVPEA